METLKQMYIGFSYGFYVHIGSVIFLTMICAYEIITDDE